MKAPTTLLAISLVSKDHPDKAGSHPHWIVFIGIMVLSPVAYGQGCDEGPARQWRRRPGPVFFHAPFAYLLQVYMLTEQVSLSVASHAAMRLSAPLLRGADSLTSS